MADAIVSSILEQLVSILGQQAEKEVKLVVGVDREVEKLKSNLGAVQAVLEDAERRYVKDAPVREWLDELKDVSYDIDDVLDEWNTAILKLEGDEHAPKPTRKVCSFIPVSYCFRFCRVARRRDIAIKIKELNEKLDDIAVKKDRYSFSLLKGIGEPERSITTSTVIEFEQRMTSSFVDQTKVVGRYEERETLIQMLLKESGEGPTLRIISIIGMGGIGKTSIAQQVYNDHRVKVHFEKRIWVCVSDPFDKKRVAKAILEELGEPQPNLNELNALLQSISKHIRGNKFLLVLDDVWSEDYCEWEQLQSSLQYGLLGSKILVTTRKQTVATTTVQSTHLFHLGKLPDEECWDLFSQVAFYGWTSEECQRVQDIGRKIVKKFDGLPLAAKIIGSLLRTKKIRQQWENVLDSEWWKVTERDLFPFLLLSYHDLSPSMRRCFSYCAIFPKDSVIVKDDIVKLWMAQGYFGAVNSRNMEFVGHETFNNLAMRSFFQDFEKDENRSIWGCRMHDIVHDFAEFLMEKECLKIEVDGPQELGTEVSSHVKARHLTLVLTSGISIPAPIYNLKHLRTLMIMDGDESMKSNVFSQSTCLRALHLSSWIGSIPEEIGKLIHLRYLGLVYCLKLEKLPETVCNLYNLQTLNVTHCISLQKLPHGLEKLVNLWHLELAYSGVSLLPKGIGKLTALQTLGWFQVGNDCDDDKASSSLKDLMNLNQLQGSLCIRGLGSERDVIEAKKAELQNKKQLISLSLVFSQVGEGAEKEEGRMRNEEQIMEGLQPSSNLEELQIENYKGIVFPDWMTSSLIKLRRIELAGCPYCEFLPPLGKLPSLKELLIGGLWDMKGVKIVGTEFLGMESNHPRGTSSSSSPPIVFFPKLQFLLFWDLSEWEEWDYSFQKGTRDGVEDAVAAHSTVIIMPSLQTLRIGICPKLKTVPDHLLRSETLNMDVTYCPNLEHLMEVRIRQNYPTQYL